MKPAAWDGAVLTQGGGGGRFPDKKGEAPPPGRGQKPAWQRPSPGCLSSLHLAGFCPAVFSVPFQLLLSPNRRRPGLSCLLSPGAPSPGLSQGFVRSPPRSDQHLPRPRPRAPSLQITSVLNPKSCQLNRCLRLRRPLLTSGEAGEARLPPTRGVGKAPPGDSTVVYLSAHSRAIRARSKRGSSKPHSHPASRAKSLYLLQDPERGPPTALLAQGFPHPNSKTPNLRARSGPVPLGPHPALFAPPTLQLRAP